MVDVGRFHGQVAGRVEGVTFLLRGPVGCLTHRQEVKVTVLSLLSKKSLDPTLWTTVSQEYTERVQLVSVARMASVANTFP